MYRPAYPRVIHNAYRNHGPYNSQWSNAGSHGPPSVHWGSRAPRPLRQPHINRGNHEEHWCETCDRGFATFDLLDKHKQQHQKCNIDGCQFVAHPKVITRHIQMQHSSGLYKKISKLDNPEEIKKWREERKKKYPTKANIAKKAAESKEKIERGEKMALKYEGNSNRNRSSGSNLGVKRKQGFEKGLQKQQISRSNFSHNISIKDNKTHLPPKKTKITPKAVPSTEMKNKLKPFAGILDIEFDNQEDYCNETLDENPLIEDDDYVEINHTEENPIVQEPAICGALTSLMCDYGSSDEEIDSENRKPDVNLVPTKVEIHKKDNNNEVIPPNKFDIVNENNPSNNDDDSGPEELKVVKNVEIGNSPAQTTKNKVVVVATKKLSIPRFEQKPHYKQRHKIPSTLLQKLLRKEIRQERNIVLQCIRFIKRNNYFD